MPSLIKTGARTWSGGRDREGHREYKVKHRIKCGRTEGPALALQTPGLPLPGSFWQFDDDIDVWAWCQFDAVVTPVHDEGEPNTYFDVEQTYSTRPLTGTTGTGWPGTGGSEGGGGGGGQPGGDQQRCNDQHIEDPLLEPLKISGGTTTYTEQGVTDRFNARIANSAHQLIQGPENEWDNNRSQFTVEQNWPVLEYALCDGLVDCVNTLPVFGFPARSVKLSRFTWRLNLHGLCYFYFTRIFEFEVRLKRLQGGTAGTADDEDAVLVGDWDRDLRDVGTKVLHGRWKDGNWILMPVGREAGVRVWPDANKASDFRTAVDRDGNPMEIVLNGAGLPANVKYRRDDQLDSSLADTGPPGTINVQKYHGANFLNLGL